MEEEDAEIETLIARLGVDEFDTSRLGTDQTPPEEQRDALREYANKLQDPAPLQDMSAAVERLMGMGEKAVEPLLRALRSPFWSRRMNAALLLGEIGDPRAVEPLLPLLNDRSGMVGGIAADALGKLGDRRAVEPLIAALSHESPDRPALWAGTSGLLGKLRLMKVVLDGSFMDNAAQAAEALGRLGDPRAVEPLIASLDRRRNDFALLPAAAEALGKLGDRRAVEPLIALLGREDLDATPAVRSVAWNAQRAVAEALGRLGDPRAIPPLQALVEKMNRRLPPDDTPESPDQGPDQRLDWVRRMLEMTPEERSAAMAAMEAHTDRRAAESVRDAARAALAVLSSRS